MPTIAWTVAQENGMAFRAFLWLVVGEVVTCLLHAVTKSCPSRRRSDRPAPKEGNIRRDVASPIIHFPTDAAEQQKVRRDSKRIPLDRCSLLRLGVLAVTFGIQVEDC
jgi:hypothetical protein